ncbi:MAG: hypothetical protein B7X10_06310 [Burkholderiales bacterium 21-58-4]|nr:MAG: hypothetical protein B7X10_06310 [Burkholderiales bacterium 21-58-4]
MTVTLAAIEEKQSELAKMIERFKSQGASFVIPGSTITLKYGERYAGIILDDEGDPDYHLILLPGEAESIQWEDATKWAADLKGELPTRREQSLLFANLKGEFKNEWCWSGERREDERYAWYQLFTNGYQYCSDTHSELRARAGRRLAIL